jgi:S1-C subfamily serine protease
MLVDLIIVLLVVAAVYRSRLNGFVRQACATVGFFGGLLIGRALEPYTVNLSHTTSTRGFIAGITLLAVALLGMTAGEYLGISLKNRLVKIKLNRVDNSLGSVLTAVSVLFSLWLLATVAMSFPSSFQTQIKHSHIIAGLNDVLPPAPTVIADISRLINPNGFPDVFIGSEPIPRGDVNLPALGELSTAVNADKDSVVRVQGQGCGGIVSGSGFVVRDGLIVTNAHVVAGISEPYVQDANGTHRGEAIWFDSKLDLAILKVSGLAGQPLPFAVQKATSGQATAVLGYPGGGKFMAGPAAVLDELTASGHDIYGRGHTLRDIYEIKATIIPGNSGGPLIDKTGHVLGVVFAESTSYKKVGYTLTNSQVTGEIQQAVDRNKIVSTGQCAE